MASSKKNGHNKNARKQAPFLDRFKKRVEKLKAFAESSAKRFATAPHSDVSDSLGAITDSIDAILEALPKLAKWTPPQRNPAFSVGDRVVFKVAKADELIKSGLYKKADLEGDHPIQAIAGRKVRLPLGMFQSLYVTKSAEA